MMFTKASFLHQQEQLQAASREVKHVVYSKRQKFYFFPSAYLQIVQPSFR